MRDYIQLSLLDKAPLSSCVLVREGSQHNLYEIKEMDPLQEAHEYCLKHVPHFQQIPINHEATSIRCLAFHGHILVLAIDDLMLAVVDIR